MGILCPAVFKLKLSKKIIHFYRYIDLVDNLRSYGLERELPLPQVAVLGVQSSGKSSVLEAISGVQLPRGTGNLDENSLTKI